MKQHALVDRAVRTVDSLRQRARRQRATHTIGEAEETALANDFDRARGHHLEMDIRRKQALTLTEGAPVLHVLARPRPE